MPWVSERRSDVTLWRPALVLDGQLLIVEVELSAACPDLVALWLEHRFAADRVAERWQALLPVPLGAVGPQPLRLECGGKHWRFDVPVVLGVYPESVLRVDPKFDKKPPARAADEQAAMARAFAKSAGERLWTQAFVKPAVGVETSGFGVRRTFNGKMESRHRGLDLDGRTGAEVYAANDGVVALVAKDFYFTGNAVLLDHGRELFTVYFHMSRVVVSEGQRVRAGDRLGDIGSTGRVTGPHLHFGVRYAATYVNPWDLLRLRPGTLASQPDAAAAPASAAAPATAAAPAADTPGPVGESGATTRPQ